MTRIILIVMINKKKKKATFIFILFFVTTMGPRSHAHSLPNPCPLTSWAQLGGNIPSCLWMPINQANLTPPLPKPKKIQSLDILPTLEFVLFSSYAWKLVKRLSCMKMIIMPLSAQEFPFTPPSLHLSIVHQSSFWSWHW